MSKSYITSQRIKRADGTEKIIPVRRTYKVKDRAPEQELRVAVRADFERGLTKNALQGKYSISAYKVRKYLK